MKTLPSLSWYELAAIVVITVVFWAYRPRPPWQR